MCCLLSWTVLTSFSLLTCWSSLRGWGHIVLRTNWPLTSGKTQGTETPTHGTLQCRGSVHSVFCWSKDGYPQTQWQTTSAICEHGQRTIPEYRALPVKNTAVVSLTWVQLIKGSKGFTEEWRHAVLFYMSKCTAPPLSACATWKYVSWWSCRGGFVRSLCVWGFICSLVPERAVGK